MGIIHSIPKSNNTTIQLVAPTRYTPHNNRFFTSKNVAHLNSTPLHQPKKSSNFLKSKKQKATVEQLSEAERIAANLQRC